MPSSRRRLLLLSLTTAAGLFVGRGTAPAQLPTPQTRTPRSPNDPGEDAENPTAAAASTKAMLEQRQKDIKKQIEKLYDLASQLKREIEKTDATAVLSLAMVKKAEEIEKLARHIKENARG